MQIQEEVETKEQDNMNAWNFQIKKGRYVCLCVYESIKKEVKGKK